jgi:hypothetical protein
MSARGRFCFANTKQEDMQMSVKSMKSERKAAIARERRRLRQIDNDRNRHDMSGYMRLYRARKRAEAEQGGE